MKIIFLKIGKVFNYNSQLTSLKIKLNLCYFYNNSITILTLLFYYFFYIKFRILLHYDKN